LLKSLVGKSIAAQENELELQQSSSEPSADAREKQIQQAVRQARDRVSAALGPILQGIMSERGANIVIDKGGVVLDLIDIDITNEAIRELDGAMQSTPVTLDKMP
jgi:Skp family chaperone for outer membrane proteins